MMRAVVRALAAALVFGAALLFAPGLALAHESGATHQAGDAQIGLHSVHGAVFVASCPGGSSHVCGCGNLEALARAGEASAAAFPRPVIGATLCVRAKRSTALASTRSLLSLSSTRPRAPPLAA